MLLPCFQVFESGNPKADEIVLSNMTVALDRILLDVEVAYNFISTTIMWKLLRKTTEWPLVWDIAVIFQDPFMFSPYHKAIRKPFDYYTFGQNYIRPLIDFE